MEAIVIGSGMAGMVSAVLLAMHGYRVTIHERHSRPGGLLHRFWRRGVPYETGFHYLGGIGHDDILGRCLRHLGVYERLQWRPLDPAGFDRLLLPDMEFRVPVGLERYKERLQRSFPEEARGIDGFLAELEEATRYYGLYRFNPLPDSAGFLRVEGATLQEVLRRYVRDPRLRTVLCGQQTLYGVPPSRAPFGLHAVVIHHFLKGAWRVVGGGDALSAALIERLQELGGSLRLRSQVTGLLAEGRRAVGVELADGGQQAADLVVSNMHPRLLLDLLPPGLVRKAYRSRILAQRFGIAHLGVYVELDSAPHCIGNANVYRFSSHDPERVLDDIEPGRAGYYFAAAPEAQRDARGEKRHTVLMSVPLRHQRVARWADSAFGRRPQAYRDYKRSLERTALAALLGDFPELESHILRVESSTPLSTEHFTGSPEGAMYGHLHSVDQMGRYRLPQIIRVRNLIQVGQAVFTPGVLGTTLSAYYGCGYHLGRNRLHQELEST